jgi:hypothetical protein
MIPLTGQILEMIKKHGAIGVLALWLGYTHFEVQDLKDRLFHCLEGREYTISKDKKEEPIIPERSDSVAILTEDGKRLVRR